MSPFIYTANVLLTDTATGVLDMGYGPQILEWLKQNNVNTIVAGLRVGTGLALTVDCDGSARWRPSTLDIGSIGQVSEKVLPLSSSEQNNA